MPILVGEREQKMFTLEAKDAIEAIVQYIEAETQERIPRTGLTLNISPDNKSVTLVVSSPSPMIANQKPPTSGDKLH